MYYNHNKNIVIPQYDCGNYDIWVMGCDGDINWGRTLSEAIERHKSIQIHHFPK